MISINDLSLKFFHDSYFTYTLCNLQFKVEASKGALKYIF